VLAEAGKIRDDMAKGLKAIDPKKYNRGPSDFGYVSLTPCSDGKNVYIWFANCVTACLDLDGNRKWSRQESAYENFEHGWSTSPIVTGGKVITYMRALVAYDAASGKTAWTTPLTALEGPYPGGRMHGSFCEADIGGTKVVITNQGDIFRVADGKKLCSEQRFGQTQNIATPVIDDGVLVRPDLGARIWPPTADSGGAICTAKLPSQAKEDMKLTDVKCVDVNFGGYPKYYNEWYIASPLVHDGLIYQLNSMGVLTVVDIKESKIVYQKYLDLNQFEFIHDGAARGIGASVTLGGKYIYVMSNFGTCLVIKPGRTYQQVAKNRFEQWVPVLDDGYYRPWEDHIQKTIASPIFDGKCMYYRAERNLYCIGEK